jgi:signal peptidase II
MKLTKGQIAFIAALLVIVLDQGSKIWVKTSMYLSQEINVAGYWFFIHFTENNGMAFGLEFAGEYGKLFLTIFRIFAVTGILIYLIKIIRDGVPTGLVVSIALIFAGALGNILDSVFYGVIFDHSYHQIASMFPEDGGYSTWFYGKVVDMLYFPMYSGHFPDWFPFWGGDPFLFFRPVFNIADSAISVGVALIVLFQKRFFPK